MHTLNLPRGHLVRMALLALLLTLATMALIAAVRPVELGSGGGSSAAPEATPPQDVRPAPSQPAWAEDPLAPPTLRLER